MNIYIASSFNLIPKVKSVCFFLEQNLHVITEKWWCRPYQVEGIGEIQTSDLKKVYEDLTPIEFYNKPECKMSFELDFIGVKNADALVFVADDKERKYNGANIELGIAIGDNKPCFSIGTLENSVLYYPVKQCRDIAHLISQIHKLEVRGEY